MENKQIHNPTRSELITEFVKSNPEYYIKEFQKIGSKPSFSFSFNLYAGILGPIWFGMRNIWNWALAFLIIICLLSFEENVFSRSFFSLVSMFVRIKAGIVLFS